MCPGFYQFIQPFVSLSNKTSSIFIFICLYGATDAMLKEKTIRDTVVIYKNYDLKFIFCNIFQYFYGHHQVKQLQIPNESAC